jgi:hypothetical protein
MIDLLVFWLSLYGQVALLGFQSRNVNTGQVISAAATSATIGAFQVLVVRSMTSHPLAITLAISCTSGPAGIVTSMYLHKRLFRKEV